MPVPKWYVVVAVIALLWNLLGCVAYLADVSAKPETMTPQQQALRAARPAWAVAATATAVWLGAAGCIGLLVRRRWATPLLVVSLIGIAAQDFGLFVLARQIVKPGPPVFVIQGLVLAVGIALVMLARTAARRGWMKGAAVAAA